MIAHRVVVTAPTIPTATYAVEESLGNYRQTRCCGVSPYDIDIEVCCSSIKSQRRMRARLGLSCCGSISYNRYTHLCCNRTIMLRGTSTSCCGYTPYNSYKHICCSGTLKPRGSASSCCGSTPYNHYTRICCGEQVREQRQNVGCCGSLFYNRENLICCGEKYFSDKVRAFLAVVARFSMKALRYVAMEELTLWWKAIVLTVVALYLSVTAIRFAVMIMCLTG